MADPKPPEFSPPALASAPAPKPKKARPIPRTIQDVIEALVSGRAKNLTEAAKGVGVSREYCSRFLSKRPDAVTYMQQRAARVLGVASTVAAARMAALIHAESEHVSFRAAEHVLGVSGIAPANQPQVSINIEAKAGWVLDLREPEEIASDNGKVIEASAKPVE
jgi:hypothetical protein